MARNHRRNMATSSMESPPGLLALQDGQQHDLPGPGAGRPRKVLNLALQGGGAHGAFTWGVLDALLGDTGLDFEGVSGSSAGAMNAVVMAFRESELTVDVLLASACLPRIHHPVEIDGEPYWDGGYSANPAVFPLFYDCDAPDVLLVLLSPLHREETPQTRERIQERIVELGFNSSFMREMHTFSRASAFAGPAFATRGRLEHKLQTMRFHMIEPGQPVSMQRAETQLLAHTPYLELLHAQGRERTAAWLGEHAAAVGTHSSIDVARCFD